MRTKTELSQLDEKTSLQLIALQSTRDDDDDDELMNLKNVKVKKKTKKTAFQLSSGQDTCSVPTGINDECTPTRKGIGALKEKRQGYNRLVNTCSTLHKDNLQVTRVI